MAWLISTTTEANADASFFSNKKASDAFRISVAGHLASGIYPPSESDLQKIIEVANPSLPLMLLFAASTGARAGEQNGPHDGSISTSIKPSFA
jgi:hypothetical protein